MDDARVTIVVAPRERFGGSERSLDNLFAHTTMPFALVYVSAGAPPRIQRYLEGQSRQRGFRLISVAHYLSPNEARNLGLREVRTPYVVFMDNDALVTPGWLDALVRCADETHADVVGPLYVEGEIADLTRLDPARSRARIHMAGGKVQFGIENGARILHDEHLLAGMPLAAHRDEIVAGPCDYVEFHTLLARADVFDRVGPLDEALLSVNEHIDFCLDVRRAGGTVYLQPAAVTSYVPPPVDCDWQDCPYFMLRWSECWNRASMSHFNRKHGVAGVRFAGDRSNLDEDTVVGFARAHRRALTGLRFPVDATDRPGSPAQEAELMLALLHSVDRDTCGLSISTPERLLEQHDAVELRLLMQRLPGILREADAQGHSVTIRPRAQGHPNEPAVLCIDGVDRDGHARLKPYAFMTLETGAQRFQCWLAIIVGAANSAIASRLRAPAPDALGVRGAGPASAGVLLAGSRDPRAGHGARVEISSGQVGLVTALAHLEREGLTPYLWTAQRF